MAHQISRFLLVIFLSLSLGACGFHLRGKIEVPENLKLIHIISDDLDLSDQLSDGLAFSDIITVEAQDSVAVLDMSKTNYSREVNSTNSNGIATSYQLMYIVRYELFDPEQNSILKQAIRKKRTLAYDPAEVLQFEREEEFLKEEMQEAIVGQMLRRLDQI